MNSVYDVIIFMSNVVHLSYILLKIFQLSMLGHFVSNTLARDDDFLSINLGMLRQGSVSQLWARSMWIGLDCVDRALIPC